MIKKWLLFASVLSMIVSCGDRPEICTLEDFVGFDSEKLDTSQYILLGAKLTSELRPGLVYNFKSHSNVAFAKHADFTLLSFEIDSLSKFSLDQVKIESCESKIKLRKCYYECGYMGTDVKFRSNDTLSLPSPSLRIMSDNLVDTLVNDRYIYFEGWIRNIGVYIAKEEFIFRPLDNNIFANKDIFYVKGLLIRDERRIVVYLLYSKNLIELNLINDLNLNIPLPDTSQLMD